MPKLPSTALGVRLPDDIAIRGHGDPILAAKLRLKEIQEEECRKLKEYGYKPNRRPDDWFPGSGLKVLEA